MELYVNLYRKRTEKSLLRILFGIAFLLFATAWIVIRLIEDKNITPFDWIYFGFFTLNGAFHLIEGLGYSFDSFFGKAYMLINSEFILLKTSAYDKEQTISWSDIKSIGFKVNKLEIKKTDNKNRFVNLSNIDNVSINKIKETVNYHITEKNIASSD